MITECTRERVDYSNRAIRKGRQLILNRYQLLGGDDALVDLYERTGDERAWELINEQIERRLDGAEGES